MRQYSLSTVVVGYPSVTKNFFDHDRPSILMKKVCIDAILIVTTKVIAMVSLCSVYYTNSSQFLSHVLYKIGKTDNSIT